MSMSMLKIIAEILGNKSLLVEVANVCDKAYATGTGNPDWYSPYGEEKPENVAQNVAGLQAIISGIGIIATTRGVNVDENVLDILVDIVDEKVNCIEKNILLRLANCAWGAGQPFRTDKGALGRLTKMNVFDLLPQIEVDKDFHQIKAAAGWLLNQLQK